MIFPLPPSVGPQAARTSRLYPTLPGIRFASNQQTTTTLSSPSIIRCRFASTLSGPTRISHHQRHYRAIHSFKGQAITSSPPGAPTAATTATSTAATTLIRSQQTQLLLSHSRLSQLHYAEPLSPAIFSRHAYRNYNTIAERQSIRSCHNFADSSNASSNRANAVSTTPLTLIHRQFGSGGGYCCCSPAFAMTGSGQAGRRAVPSIMTLSQERAFHSGNSTQYSQPYFAMKNSQGDTLRVHLEKYRDVVGLRSTRCQRKYNQDRYKVLVLDAPQLEPGTASSTNNNPIATTTPPAATSNNIISQIDADQKTLFYFAIFDGHGGSNTADYLTANLDQCIEAAKPDMVPKVIKDLRKLGGYFRNFRPHFLEPFLPADFEKKGAKDNADRARQQRKVHIPGKGGQIKPMIFIPHPNATEDEQEQELKSLENQTSAATAASGTTEAPLSDEQRKQKERAATNKPRVQMPREEEEEDEYDEDDDPFVIARRRNLNRTSPLPGGTTAYFGTDRSEYASLSLREEELIERKRQKQAATTAEAPAPIPTTMTLEQRLCLSFLQCDAELVRDKYRDGSTASIVIVQSKGAFWETPDDLDLILAHVGDTRVLLCEAPRGESIQLTTDHHPDAVVEADRIRRMAAYVSADSFGENMFLGQLANTRALGDIAMKPFGVSAEPELIRRTVKASEAAFLVLISDGISSVMSNQEVVDCIKLEESPTQAAANVLNLAEQLGAEDNCTIMVVKLPAWGAKMPDLSKELREYRWQSEAQQSRARRR